MPEPTDVPTPEETPQGLTTSDAAEEIFGLLNPEDPEEDNPVPAGEGGDEPPVSESEEEAPEAPAEGDEVPDDEASEAEESDAEPEEPSDDEPEQTFEVQVHGEMVEVTLGEALRGYQRQADYTRKTQDVAEQREAVQTEQQRLRAEREQYGQKLQLVEQFLQEQMPEAPDPADMGEDVDPREVAERMKDYRERKEVLDAVRARQQEIQQQQFADLQQQLEEGRERLREEIPGWDNPDTMQEDVERMTEHAQLTYGFTPEDLSTVTDPRLVQVLRDAMLYHDTRAKMETARKKVTKPDPSPTLEPGSTGGEQKKSPASDARKRLAKTGRVEDGAAAIQELLAAE